jgi:hypothetical protein
MATKKQILATFDNAETEWEDYLDFMHEVQTKIVDRLKTDKFFVYGLALTWRMVSGYMECETTSAAVLLRKLLPNTSEWRIEFYTTEKPTVIAVILYHHDAPTGEKLHLMSQATAKRNKIKEKYFTN